MSTVGGLGGMSLPLSVDIVATDISLGDNGGAEWNLGWWVGKTKNASCSELRSLPLPGRETPIYANGSRAHGSRAMASGRERDPPYLFHHPSNPLCALPNWQWVVPTRHPMMAFFHLFFGLLFHQCLFHFKELTFLAGPEQGCVI